MSQPSVTTGPQGQGVTNDLIKWLKTIFGGAFTVSRGYSGKHDGIDLPAKEGSLVKAIKSGYVSYARDARTASDKGASGWAIGGGKVVNIDVGGKLTTQYAHLASIKVREGEFVKAGQIIGTVGRTGGTTDSGQPGGPGSQFVGAHLHFGLWDKNVNRMVNPQTFLESIGDTSNSQAADALRSIGVSTDPSHVFTDEDIKKIATLYGVKPELIYSKFQGKTVADFLSGKENLGAGPLDAITDPIANALGAIGLQLQDTFLWLGFILLGLVLIGGGIYLLKPSEVIKESA